MHGSCAGLFMAKQKKLIACGKTMTVIAILLKFFAGPAAMAVSCIAMGLHGDVLRVAIIQVKSPPLINLRLYVLAIVKHWES